ncbi:putative transcription factor TFIIE complex alpha subunit [Aspergillus clavatus NRRL 1]|uniref:Transcription factor TFIIE complex alpha subunit, putative n=1 Tax=Aspergillus clavatus (strain ATCC 1007 / CBS 513.65 / DSM 816 / NCTC 3887 / NRRL 1 / QM 1276 / 107) TaxID=344612 RepID=A1CSQ8_ASPCL|nr:transcription factor TFIIE complex alpha subunit, putative [Aspergillus clavatus NRRL 1]EAW06345.1 transcription factor TFIIE complex alpha subunit, putative [Aspergillus clavatus NRRL 1]
MDLANTLIRSVVRAFYETRHILVVDALFIHSVLHAEDLAFLLGMQQKDLRKLCARLREDRLISVSTRAEIRDGATRPVNREYYYIPLHPVIDAIKYKVSKLTSTIKTQYTPSEERKEYVCLRCGAEWTELDVLSLYSDEGFECQNCGAILERTEDVKGTEGIDRTGHEKNSKLMAQLDIMLKLLKQIDSVEIPPNDFDTAWDHKVDVLRNQQTNPTRAAVILPSKQQEAVRGNLKTDSAALEISLTSSAEKSAAEQAEEAARKAAFEKQNALPVWHTHSTVSTSAGNINRVKTDPDAAAAIKSEIKEEEDIKPKIEDLDDKVAAYYAEMEREKALQAQRDASSADEDDSDDFDEEFEDVGGVSASDTASPAAMGAGVGVSVGGRTPTSAPTSAPLGIKREFDTDSGTSAPQTAVGTPVTPADEGPAMKKVKLEPDVKKEESDEDDEEEFEDV